jgi:AraC family transcriptional regulator, exoenzyme S synthesis regulatory protein ExsA
MNEYILPSDFLKSGQIQIPQAFIYPYRTDKSTIKNRVVLTTHLFSFLTEGSKEIVISDNKLKLEESHFALIKAGNCFMSEKISEKNKYASILIFFANELLQAFHLIHQQKINEVIKKGKMQNKEVLHFKNDAFTKAFAQSLAFVPLNSTELIKLKLQEILFYLLETQPEELCSVFATAQNNNDDLLFKNIVDSNIDSNLSVQELAFLCNMSLSTFKRKFTKVFNDSPTNWIRQKRMERAAFLLTYNKERPSDIYLRLGYENFSSFTQSFKSIYGKTPKEYQLSSLS